MRPGSAGVWPSSINPTPLLTNQVTSIQKFPKLSPRPRLLCYPAAAAVTLVPRLCLCCRTFWRHCWMWCLVPRRKTEWRVYWWLLCTTLHLTSKTTGTAAVIVVNFWNGYLVVQLHFHPVTSYPSDVIRLRASGLFGSFRGFGSQSDRIGRIASGTQSTLLVD